MNDCITTGQEAAQKDTDKGMFICISNVMALRHDEI